MGGTDPTKRYMPPVLPESLIGDLLYGKVYLVADARLEIRQHGAQPRHLRQHSFIELNDDKLVF